MPVRRSASPSAERLSRQQLDEHARESAEQAREAARRNAARRSAQETAAEAAFEPLPTHEPPTHVPWAAKNWWDMRLARYDEAAYESWKDGQEAEAMEELEVEDAIDRLNEAVERKRLEELQAEAAAWEEYETARQNAHWAQRLLGCVPGGGRASNGGCLENNAGGTVVGCGRASNTLTENAAGGLVVGPHPVAAARPGQLSFEAVAGLGAYLHADEQRTTSGGGWWRCCGGQDDEERELNALRWLSTRISSYG